MCLSVLFECMSAHHEHVWCLQKPSMAIQALGTGVTDCCEVAYGCQGSNLGLVLWLLSHLCKPLFCFSDEISHIQGSFRLTWPKLFCFWDEISCILGYLSDSHDQRWLCPHLLSSPAITSVCFHTCTWCIAAHHTEDFVHLDKRPPSELCL